MQNVGSNVYLVIKRYFDTFRSIFSEICMPKNANCDTFNPFVKL